MRPVPASGNARSRSRRRRRFRRSIRSRKTARRAPGTVSPGHMTSGGAGMRRIGLSDANTCSRMLVSLRVIRSGLTASLEFHAPSGCSPVPESSRDLNAHAAPHWPSRAGGSHLCAPALQRFSAPGSARLRTLDTREALAKKWATTVEGSPPKAPHCFNWRLGAWPRPRGALTDRPRTTGSRLGLALPCRVVEQRGTLVDDVHGEQLQRDFADHREPGMPDPALVQYGCSGG